MRLFIDNWRWAGVPFYLRTGKALPISASEVRVQFRPTPNVLFAAQCGPRLDANALTLRLQPNEGISLRFNGKVPGNAADVLLGPQATPEVRAAFIKRMGLDRPVWERIALFGWAAALGLEPADMRHPVSNSSVEILLIAPDQMKGVLANLEEEVIKRKEKFGF